MHCILQVGLTELSFSWGFAYGCKLLAPEVGAGMLLH